MYSKEEKKQLIIDFWSELNETLTYKGKKIGRNLDWMNYPTKIKGLYFRMEFNDKEARLCIDLQFTNDGVREVFFEQFEEFKKAFHQKINKSFWEKNYEHSNGKTISRIYFKIDNVDIEDKNTWETAKDFLSESFLKLDAFWQEFNEVFYALK